MSTTYRTCKHVYDTGGTCASASVKDQHYCGYHLHHRARLMRMAQYRARNRRFALRLPPLENMYAVQSALNQLAEAAAAGMIELKQARFLLSVIRAAGQFLLHADKWQANPYHSEQPAPAIDLATEYGLPNDLDLDLTPEAAFPANQNLHGVILSEEDAIAADESKDPFVSANSRGLAGAPHAGVPDERRSCGRWGGFSPVFGERVGTDSRPPAADNSLPAMPFSGNYCGDHHSRECECMRIRADHPMTPEMVEVVEVSETYGSDVAANRSKQLMRNAERRRLNRDRKRYAAVALERNMRRAADIIAERKLAERASQQPQEDGEQNAEIVPRKPALSANSDAARVPEEKKSLV